MWEARAEYSDGSTIERYFYPNAELTDAEDMYRIECWLIEREKECVWYSVNWIQD